MTFISYAQNFEDIMLWRALKHVEQGFYIDVGANDPAVDSVTLAFYERGWRGINVEPMRQYHDLLLTSRTRDINLPVAVGDADGEIVFYDVPDTGLSTTDPAIAEQHKAAGRNVIEERIAVATLTGICDTYVEGPVHFLKIDVEGFEAAVLRGMDFGKWRPWILVIEATKPQTQVTAYEEWEHMVLGAGYRAAYFDGLNQFYVAEEHAELMRFFKAPPNFFDEFQLRPGHWFSYPIDEYEKKLEDAETHAMQAEMRAREADAQFANAEAEVFKAQAHAEQMALQAHHAHVQSANLHAQLVAVYASTSWRVTRPLRAIKLLTVEPAITLRRMMPFLPKPRTFLRRVLGRAMREVHARPRLRQFIVGGLARFPSLDKKLRSFGALAANGGASVAAAQTGNTIEVDLKSLSASARQVLADMERTVGNE